MTDANKSRYGKDGKYFHRTEAEETAAKAACFADCSAGLHLDFEAGCCRVCKCADECKGWVPYLAGGER